MLRLWLVCIMVALLVCACGPKTKGPTPGKTTVHKPLKPTKRQDFRVRYLFAEGTTKAPGSKMDIFCVARKDYKASLSYRLNNGEWQSIKADVKPEKLQFKKDQHRYVVKHNWQVPDVKVKSLELRVVAVPAKGKPVRQMLVVDCVAPRSKVTYDPFSL